MKHVSDIAHSGLLEPTFIPMVCVKVVEGYEFEPKEASCDKVVSTSLDNLSISFDKASYQLNDVVQITVIAPSFNLSPYEIDCFGGGSFTGPIPNELPVTRDAPDNGYGELPDQLKKYSDEFDNADGWSQIEHSFYIISGTESIAQSSVCGWFCFDNISNMKLIETDRDTGVFTGYVGIHNVNNEFGGPDQDDTAIEYECDESDPPFQIIARIMEKGPLTENVSLASADLVNCTPVEAAEAPKTVIVDIPVGTSVPGCEITDECFTPFKFTINVGDTVEWVNVDTAAHTVTSGTPAGNVGEIFDSGLILAGGSYSFTFEKTGINGYFCMVHPWMTGTVIVK